MECRDEKCCLNSNFQDYFTSNDKNCFDLSKNIGLVEQILVDTFFTTIF